MSELRQYQREAFDFLESRHRAIYADPAGSGKTPTTCVLLDVAPPDALIVCPSDVMRHWYRQLAVWTDITPILVDGKPDARNRAYTEAQVLRKSGDPNALIMKYETLRGQDFDRIVKLGFDTIVFDEAHRLKNRKAKQTKAAAKLAKRVENLYLLTGTPMMNKPDELWSLLNLLDHKTYSSYWRWVHKYCEVERKFARGREFMVIGGPQEGREDEIREQIKPVMIQRPLEELLPELPDITETEIEVVLTPKERKLYDQLKDNFFAQIEDETIVIPNPVALTTRLRQITNDWSELVNADKPGSKVKATAELVSDLAESEQVLVLTAYKSAARSLAELLDAGMVTGDVSGDERDSIVEQFRRGELRVLVGTLATLGEGVDGLQSARHIVMHDRDWTPARNEQAIARVRRSGQVADKVFVYYVTALGTIDEDVKTALETKQDLIDVIFRRG